MAHDVNLVKVKNQNILSHLSQSDKEDLGPLTQIQVDRHEKHVVTVFGNGYLLIFRLTKEDAAEDLVYVTTPLRRFGPFGSCQQIYVDDFCTYMAILGENSRSIIYYLIDWQHECKLVSRPVSQTLASALLLKRTKTMLEAQRAKDHAKKEEEELAENTRKEKQRSSVCILF